GTIVVAEAAAEAAQPAPQEVVPPTQAAAAPIHNVAAREPEPAAPAAQRTVLHPSGVNRPAAVLVQEPRITVHFQESPILDVLSTFAEFSGRSIVAGASVNGTVTADIRDQPWDIALREILHSHALGAVETESGIIRVDAIEKVREREKVEDLDRKSAV